MLWGVRDLRVNELGPGWRAPRPRFERSRQIYPERSKVPELVLLWYDDEAGSRMAFVGKGLDWYHSVDGPWELERDYGEAVASIAGVVQEAIDDTLLGYYAAWPDCPVHNSRLFATGAGAGVPSWACNRNGGHVAAELGHLTTQ